MSKQPFVVMNDIDKSFSSNQVLKKVNFSVNPG